MSDTVEFKQDLMTLRNLHVNMKKEINKFIGKEIFMLGEIVNLPVKVQGFKIEDIDVSENNVCVSWHDPEEDERILEDITIKQFVQYAQFR